MAYQLKTSPGHLLRRAQQYANDTYSKGVGSKGPTPRQFEVLHVVSQNEGLSQTDLVQATGIDRSTLADMIARMIAKGLLSRKRTKADARANAVSITATGKRMLAGALASVSKSDKEIISVLPKTQQSAFLKSLQAFAEELDKLEQKAAAPKKRAAKKKAPAKKKAAKKKAPAKKKAAKRGAKRR